MAAAAQLPARNGDPRPLTQASDIRTLTPDQAQRNIPVHVTGVITDSVPAPDFFVQDRSAGIYVEGSHAHAYPHHIGDLVEVDGVTGPGRFAPVIRETSSRIVGTSPLPEPKLYTFSELAGGHLDSQWVQIRGVIRSVWIDRTTWPETTLGMNVGTGTGQFKVRAPVPRDQDFSSWVGNEAVISGVCGTLFNTERQFTGLLMYVPRLSFIKVQMSARDVPLSDLLRFSPSANLGQRVRVRGVASYSDPGGGLFVQAHGKGLRIRTQANTPEPVSPGDIVDVLGFAAVGESAPVLEDALFSRVGHSPPPVPVDFNRSGNWERYDGLLVKLDAKLLHYGQTDDGLALLLQHGGEVFSAAVPPGNAGRQLMNIPLSSDLRLTGICLVRNGGWWHVPQSFRLLLRSDRDVEVLHRPSWWNLQHAAWLLGGMAGVLSLALAWTFALRRRVREQMLVIREKLRTGAVLEERNRIARELHDTLEQDLAGITLHLDLAVDSALAAPDLSRQAVETARRMSRRSMIEARRSVWDLRSHLLENGTLSAALAQAVEPLAAHSQVKIRVDVKGDVTRLTPKVEMNALRIGQEAITNAIKHARATVINVLLEYAAGSLHLSVADDGCGFNDETAAMASGAHFGLLDMKERAEGLGSRFEIRSTPGRGTCIAVEIPIERSLPAHAESSHDATEIHSYSRR